MSGAREGEIALETDPATLVGNSHVVFIGRVNSPWRDKAECPKNMAAARASGQPATVEIDLAYRAGLAGLERFSHIALLTWLDRSRRDLIVQKPGHAPAATGVFSIRSPARPNPVGLHIARVLSLDTGNGTILLEGIDVLDGTPVIDVKPYFASTDSVPDASGGEGRK